MKIALFIKYFVVVLFLLNSVASSVAFEARIGEIKNVSHTCCRVDTEWNRCKRCDCTWSAESGWYVLEVSGTVVSSRRRPSFRISKTSAGIIWTDDSRLNMVFDDLRKSAREQGKDNQFREEIEQKRRMFIETYRRASGSHSRIEVIGESCGDRNFLRRYPGRLYLDLEIKIMRFATKDEVDRIIEDYKRKIVVGVPSPLTETRLPTGSVNIVGYYHSECMHASHSTRVGSGKDIYRRPCGSSLSDRFYLKPSSSLPGYHTLVNQKFGTCVHASSYNDKIYHTTCNSSNPKDYFKIIPKGNNLMTIQSKSSGKCIHFSSNIRAQNGSSLAIYQFPCDGSEKNLVYFRK